MMICALTSVFSSMKPLIRFSKQNRKIHSPFNDTRLKTGQCADGTNFQKSESVALVFRDKSVCS
jgi:hypothetical protein